MYSERFMSSPRKSDDLPWSGAGRTLRQAAPEEVRENPKQTGERGGSERHGTIAYRDVAKERRDEVDAEAGVAPLLESRRAHGEEQCSHARHLGPRELHAEVVGWKAEAGERLRRLRQDQ